MIVAELRSKKQEKFVKLVVQGMPQREAFRAVYSNNMTDAQVDSEASAMINGTGKYAKNPKIHLRYLELNTAAQKETEEKTIAKSAEMQQKLTEIIRQALEEEVIVVESTGDFTSEARKLSKKPSIKDVISAINTLGKMQGLFKDNLKVDVTPVVIGGDDELAD